MSQTVHHMGVSAGPRCPRCRGTEADCARSYPCCSDCRHWPHLDVNGEQVIGKPGPKPRRADVSDLMRESIPHRLTPAPTAHRGPSTRKSQEELALAASPVLATVHQITSEAS